MKFEEIPTHTGGGLMLSKGGRIHTYAEEEIGQIKRELIFSQLTDEGELIKRLQTIIDNINNLPEQDDCRKS